MNILDELFKLQDLKYRDFNAKLIPTISKEKIIGIRTPELRKLAKELVNQIDIENFFSNLPHYYLEENNLHGYLIDNIKDYDYCVEKLNQFLPYIDNWGTCDTIAVKVLSKDKNRLINLIKVWIKDEHTYTIRFAINMLMKYFLDGDFKEEYLKLVSEIRSEEYYVNMVISWYFATALAKQYDATIKYLENYRLSSWCHNKTIRKAIESYRISNELKLYLRTLIVR